MSRKFLEIAAGVAMLLLSFVSGVSAQDSSFTINGKEFREPMGWPFEWDCVPNQDGFWGVIDTLYQGNNYQIESDHQFTLKTFSIQNDKLTAEEVPFEQTSNGTFVVGDDVWIAIQFEDGFKPRGVHLCASSVSDTRDLINKHNLTLMSQYPDAISVILPEDSEVVIPGNMFGVMAITCVDGKKYVFIQPTWENYLNQFCGGVMVLIPTEYENDLTSLAPMIAKANQAEFLGWNYAPVYSAASFRYKDVIPQNEWEGIEIQTDWSQFGFNCLPVVDGFTAIFSSGEQNFFYLPSVYEYGVFKVVLDTDMSLVLTNQFAEYENRSFGSYFFHESSWVGVKADDVPGACQDSDDN